ncbi:MAG: dTDP-4-amino-4,6-dideoxygalactose transaminase [Betaproteobacteria bacterium]|nr:dTDP-4-amino-4,6-dideoxygalactose transaminase [Betaproteobacteria bacterium]
MKIPFNRPFTIGAELENIAAAVRDGHLAGDGRFTRQCHQWLERNLGAKKALLTHSCTAALEMAAILCDLRAGDEVIMPSFTFVSTANAFVLRGAVPVFVDIRPDTLNLDEKLVAAGVTSRTRAIVPVHYAGVACEMDALMALARDRELVVVEDAAQGLLAQYKGRRLGAIGHLGCLSFHETKNVISGEGGALLVNDARLAERAEIIREKGTNRAQFFRGEVDKYTWVDIGSSYLPSELVGAFLWAQLEHAGAINDRRMKLCAAYRKGLAALARHGALALPQPEPAGVTGNGHLFYVLLKDAATRARLIAHLKTRGIHSVFHYVPLHSSPAGRRYGRGAGPLPVTEDVAGRLLRLPLYHELTEAQVGIIVAEIHAFFG